MLPVDYLLKAAIESSGKAALVYLKEGETRILTYAALLERALKVRVHLKKELGLKLGEVVGVYYEDPLDYVIGLWGIWLAGMQYLPLKYTGEELRGEVGKKLAAAKAAGFLRKKSADMAALEMETLTAAEIASPTDRAYIFSSSGTSGTPKVIACSYEGLEDRVLHVAEILRCHERSRVLAFSPPTFDANILDILLAVYTQVPLCLIGEAERLDPYQLVRYVHALVADYRPTISILTPSVLALLNPDDLPSFQSIITMGQACEPGILSKWLRAARVVANGYGPTETTIAATADLITAEADRYSMSNALRGVELYLKVERNPHPIPITELPKDVDLEGELCISGKGLGEYVAASPEQRDRFRTLPGTEKKIYYTGDRVKWQEGKLYYQGRLDHQLKRNGQLVMLDEIEHALSASCSQVESVGVIYDEGKVVAFIKPRPGFERTRFMAEVARLESKLRPDCCYKIHAVPLSPHGKTSYTPDLRDPAKSEWIEDTTPIDMTDKIQVTLYEIWSRILKVSRIGRASYFEYLGGNSLSYSYMIHELATAFGIDFHELAAVKAKTFGAYAEHIKALQASKATGVGAAGGTVVIKPSVFMLPPITGDVPATYSKWLDALPNSRAIAMPKELSATTFADLVQYYKTEIERMNPGGPYILLGWSFGGILAHALAAAFEKEGKVVQKVINIDGAPPVLLKSLLPSLDMAADMISWVLKIHNQERSREDILGYLPMGAGGGSLSESDKVTYLFQSFIEKYSEEPLHSQLKATFVNLSLLLQTESFEAFSRHTAPTLTLTAKESTPGINASGAGVAVDFLAWPVTGTHHVIPCTGNHFSVLGQKETEEHIVAHIKALSSGPAHGVVGAFSEVAMATAGASAAAAAVTSAGL